MTQTSTLTAATEEPASTPKVHTYGFRVDLAGSVWAYLRTPVRGRCAERDQLQVGNVYRVAGGWRSDAVCDVDLTQTESARRLIRVICG
jgi:hypothetical protein